MSIFDEPRKETAEQIASLYSAMLSSKSLIDRLEGTQDADELDSILRNTKHLKTMISKEFWTTEDMSIFEQYIVG